MIRRAEQRDLDAVAGIYDEILTQEELGLAHTGWQRGVYPTRETARLALERGTLYVMEEEGRIVAAAKIDGEQVDVYAQVAWEHPADDGQVLVLHTLVVSPSVKGRGYGSRFVAFYESLARQLGRPYLRMDTNERNLGARGLYRKLGYREVGIVSSVFNGIAGTPLVCLEKKL